MKIFTIANVPPELQQEWLQHLRDFDAAHPGCHFEVAVDAPPDEPLAEIVKRLQVEPALSFVQVFERRKADPILDCLPFDERKAKNATIKRIDNGALYAGSPMFYYCRLCGEQIVCPETHAYVAPWFCDWCIMEGRAKGPNER